MIGILFLAAVAAWLWACVWLARLATKKTSNHRWRTMTGASVFVALISMPFVDEVIGKYQFDALCKAGGIESADLSRARGKRVKVEYVGYRVPAGTMLPVMEQDVLYRDAETGEVLIRHLNYRSEGGWLMRYTWFNMGSNHPMLFGSHCGDFAVRKSLFAKNEILQLQ